MLPARMARQLGVSACLPLQSKGKVVVGKGWGQSSHRSRMTMAHTPQPPLTMTHTLPPPPTWTVSKSPAPLPTYL
eukprot:14549999-Heterocapsa_arctica.AAC.1